MTNSEINSEEIPASTEQAYQGEIAPVMSFGEWLGALIIMIIPVLNFIMLIVWVTEQNTNPNKVNWAKATLVIIGIQLVMTMFFVGAFIGTFTRLMSGFNQTGLW